MKKVLKIATNSILGIFGVVLGLAVITAAFLLIYSGNANKGNDKEVAAEEANAETEAVYTETGKCQAERK